MSSIIASNIPLDITEAKIEEFFSFCGKIKSIKELESDSSLKVVQVVFENSGAVSTALLLNGAELGSNAIKVVEETGGEKSKALELAEDAESSTAPPPSYTENSNSSDDLPQEDKPKSAIIAQYLSQGYVLSDQLVGKLVEFDKEHGYSSKFKSFLTNLDSKYHIQDKSLLVTNEADQRLHIQSNLSSGKSKLDQYFDKFKQDKYGSKILNFYSNVVNDTKEVHEEARRLADLKKQQSSSPSPAPQTE